MGEFVPWSSLPRQEQEEFAAYLKKKVDDISTGAIYESNMKLTEMMQQVMDQMFCKTCLHRLDEHSPWCMKCGCGYEEAWTRHDAEKLEE